MNNKTLQLACSTVFLVISNFAFSQGSFTPNVNTGVGTNLRTTQIWSGISFGVNNTTTDPESFARDFDQYSFHPIIENGRMFSFGIEANAKGSRFLFDSWVRGTIVKNSGETITGDKYYFNFDKVNDNLLVTYDQKSIIEVYKDSIKSFTFTEKGEEYTFEKVPAIQRYRFVQVLAKDDSKYSLYKTINTKFVAADYNTNGLTESGKPYDEFVDRNQYFIVYNNEIRPVDLKFSSIKKAMKESSSKVKDFYADHILDDVDEQYLVRIVKYINE